MPNERSGTEAEQLSWQQQLSSAVDERVQFLRIWFATEKNGGPRYGLEGPDGTQIGIAMFPTTTEQQSSYLPDSWVVVRGDRLNSNPGIVRGAAECGTRDASFYHSAHQAILPDLTNGDEDPRLAYVIETHATRPVNVASSHSGIERLTPDDERYEMFVAPDGTLLEDVYRVGEDEELHPVEPIEGERLLWLISNSKPGS